MKNSQTLGFLLSSFILPPLSFWAFHLPLGRQFPIVFVIFYSYEYYKVKSIMELNVHYGLV
jgi:hypothetical protein